jgi:hypothetical protein
MNQTAFAVEPDARATDATKVDAAPFTGFDSTWRRNLEAGARTARAFQEQNADFASRLLDLNLEAARAFGQAAAAVPPYARPFELGASAVELCLGYLGRQTALAQHALVLPWTQARA